MIKKTRVNLLVMLLCGILLIPVGYLSLPFLTGGKTLFECEVANPIRLNIGRIPLDIPASFSPSFIKDVDTGIRSKFSYSFGLGRYVYCQSSFEPRRQVSSVFFSYRSMKFIFENLQLKFTKGISFLELETRRTERTRPFPNKYYLLQSELVFNGLFQQFGESSSRSDVYLTPVKPLLDGTYFWARCHGNGVVGQYGTCRLYRFQEKYSMLYTVEVHTTLGLNGGFPTSVHLPSDWISLIAHIDTFIEARMGKVDKGH